MRPFLLKLTATALTLGATVASASYVSGHVKNAAAPLQPPVLSAQGGSSDAVSAGGLVVGPPVQATSATPVASTYAS